MERSFNTGIHAGLPRMLHAHRDYHADVTFLGPISAMTTPPIEVNQEMASQEDVAAPMDKLPDTMPHDVLDDNETRAVLQDIAREEEYMRRQTASRSKNDSLLNSREWERKKHVGSMLETIYRRESGIRAILPCQVGLVLTGMFTL